MLLNPFFRRSYDFPISNSTLDNMKILGYYIDFTNAIETPLFSLSSFDNKNVPKRNYGSGKSYYNPVFVCLWALVSIEKYIHSKKEKYLEIFYSNVNWLCENYMETDNGCVVWTYNFDWQEGKTFLKAPWISAMSQGLTISVLVRAYRLSGNKEVLKLAKDATNVFDIEVKDGGIKTIESGYVYYEEYPAYPLARILDGFIFSLLGLYDLYLTSKDVKAKRLFDEGIRTLIHNLEYWNFKDCWSWYGSHGTLSSAMYNKLNACLLLVLYDLTGNIRFKEMGEKWLPEKLSKCKKIKIGIYYYYLLFRRIGGIPVRR